MEPTLFLISQFWIFWNSCNCHQFPILDLLEFVELPPSPNLDFVEFMELTLILISQIWIFCVPLIPKFGFSGILPPVFNFSMLDLLEWEMPPSLNFPILAHPDLTSFRYSKVVDTRMRTFSYGIHLSWTTPLHVVENEHHPHHSHEHHPHHSSGFFIHSDKPPSLFRTIIIDLPFLRQQGRLLRLRPSHQYQHDRIMAVIL